MEEKTALLGETFKKMAKFFFVGFLIVAFIIGVKIEISMVVLLGVLGAILFIAVVVFIVWKVYRSRTYIDLDEYDDDDDWD